MWAKERNEPAGSIKKFSDRLQDRGFPHGWKHPKTRRPGFSGIDLVLRSSSDLGDLLADSQSGAA
jgi:hypothetical protein